MLYPQAFFALVNAMQNQRTRRTALWNLAAAFWVVALAFFFVHQRSERDALVADAQRELGESKSVLEHQEKADLRLMQANLELLLRDDAMRSAFLARDRKRLLALAQPVFESLKSRYGITHFYFLDPPPAATCFLRVHNSALYGDKVERGTYQLAVARKGFGVGLELGQTAFALRAVHPWYSKDGKRIIGYLELGEEIGHFMEALKGQTNADYALLLDKRKLDPVIWMHMRNASGLPNDWAQRPLYVLAQDTGVVVRDLAWNGSLDKLPDEGRVLGMTRQGGRHLMRGVFPVLNAEGERSGAVLMATDVTTELRHSQWRHVLSVAFVMLALAFIGLMGGWLLALSDDDWDKDGWQAAYKALPRAMAKVWKDTWG